MQNGQGVGGIYWPHLGGIRFLPDSQERKIQRVLSVSLSAHFFSGVCVEKRAFYRLISGLHASINIHLSARYLLQGKYYFLP